MVILAIVVILAIFCHNSQVIMLAIVSLLLLVGQSLSLCVYENGTNSTCTYSSLLLVPKTQLAGYFITIENLPNISTNCTDTEKQFSATIGGTPLSYSFLDEYNNSTIQVKLCLVGKA